MLPTATSNSSPRNRGWLASSPFKKLSHLKGSCYSLPARRKLEWTGKSSDGPVKSSKSADKSGHPPPVNLVTFRAQDMSGESFSTLQMQNIMSSLQHQLGSPQRASTDLPSSDPVTATVTEEFGKDSKCQTSADPSQVTVHDDCTVLPQDAKPPQDDDNTESCKTVESLNGSATEVCIVTTILCLCNSMGMGVARVELQVRKQ